MATANQPRATPQGAPAPQTSPAARPRRAGARGGAHRRAPGIRTVEWMRDHGAREVVNPGGEPLLHAQADGDGDGDGDGRPSAPRPPAAAGREQRLTPLARGDRSHAARAYPPARIRPHPPRAGRRGSAAGHVRRSFASTTGADHQLPSGSQLSATLAGVAWIDAGRTSTWLYHGRFESAVPLSSLGPMEVPARMRPRSVATFNSGLKLSDSGGGLVTGGQADAC